MFEHRVNGKLVLRWLLVVMGIMVLMACERVSLALDGEPPPTPTPELLSQWAANAAASSHYALPDWSPQRATGAPEVSACSDDARAWASARGNGVEWLELTYTEPVYATEVRVYQTYGRGAVSRVTLLDTAGDRHVAWEGVDEAEPCPGVLAVPVSLMGTRVDTVRIELDESRTGSWNQIDAVELIGIP